ncbi:MAG: hypothetical protein U5L45_07275 [Saprospiraceae bacterium]|nr:hypothetical protein [Saprospiraceae bacterium]
MKKILKCTNIHVAVLISDFFTRIKGESVVHFSASPKNEPHSSPPRERSERVMYL